MIAEIADIRIRVDAMHPETYGFLADYEVPQRPIDVLPGVNIPIQPKEEDIAFEREKSAAEDAAEGIPVRQFSDAYLETLAVLRRLAEDAPFHGAMLFHGSAVAVDGQGYIFTAKSGTGKSTHAALWRQLLGEKAVMVNDDKPFIRIEYPAADGEGMTSGRDWPAGKRPWPFARVCGSPWNGKHRLGSNISVPLKAVCILERAEKNSIARVSPHEAYPMLLQQVYRPSESLGMQQTLKLVDELARSVEFWRLGCNMDIEAAKVSYEAMSGAAATKS